MFKPIHFMAKVCKAFSKFLEHQASTRPKSARLPQTTPPPESRNPCFFLTASTIFFRGRKKESTKSAPSSPCLELDVLQIFAIRICSVFFGHHQMNHQINHPYGQIFVIGLTINSSCQNFAKQKQNFIPFGSLSSLFHMGDIQVFGVETTTIHKVLVGEMPSSMAR